MGKFKVADDRALAVTGRPVSSLSVPPQLLQAPTGVSAPWTPKRPAGCRAPVAFRGAVIYCTTVPDSRSFTRLRSPVKLR